MNFINLPFSNKFTAKLFAVTLLSLFGMSSVHAMSCLGFGSAYQTAQDPNALIVKVELLQIDESTSAAELKVIKTYKGDTSVSQITLGPDEFGFGNAASGKKVGDVWIEIFSKSSEDNTFYSFGCSESSFEITADQKINVQMTYNQSLEFTEQEFLDYINGLKLPKISGYECSYDFSSEAASIQKEFKFTADEYGYGEQYFELDLSKEYKDYGLVKLSIWVAGNAVRLTMTDPESLLEVSSTSPVVTAENSFEGYSLILGSADSNVNSYLVCSPEFKITP